MRTRQELTPIVIDCIKAECVKFRNGIQQIQFKSSLLVDSPSGCCRDASVLLGEYLKIIGYEPITYCQKEFENNCSSHAWLEFKDLIIYITLDQFSEKFPNVFVTNTILQLDKCLS